MTSQVAESDQSSESGVLDDLDAQVPTSFYWRLTLLATLGGFLFGYDTSNIGSALNFVPYHLSGFWQGYLVAGASLGAAVGALAAGTLTDRYGRKILLITDAAIYAFGAILSAVTPDAAVLLAARTMIGLAIGADTAIATAYIAEYAPKGRRGSLAMLQQWMITVGILGAYLVALGHSTRGPRERRYGRLALDPGAWSGSGAGRTRAAHHHARVAALAHAPGSLREGPRGTR
jgi:MFS family permease